MNWIYLCIALIAGAMMPVQGAMNTKLSSYVQAPILAALVSFVVGGIGLIAYIIASGTSFQLLNGIKQSPPVTWLGGLLGAFFVTAVVITVPKLGMALTFSLLVLAQMVTTIPLDHFGWLGVPVRHVNLPRIVGIILIIGGVILIRKF